MGLCRVSGATFKKIHQGNIVDNWVGIGHNRKTGYASCCCCFAGTAQSFTIFRAGFAGKSTHIHQTGSENMPLTVEMRNIGSNVLIFRVHRMNASFGEQQRTWAVQPGCRVDKTGVM